MFKKLFCLILFVLVLTLTPTTYSEVVIGNFEQQMDGWAACGWGPPGNPDFSYGTSGVTLDGYSLKAVQPTGWYWFLINTNVNGDDFRANNIIAMDVTRLSDEWTRGTGDHYCDLDLRVQDNSRYQLNGLGNSGAWDSNDLDANDTMTVTWDYTLFKRQMPDSATGVEIIIATNTGGYTGEGTWYIDNIRLLASRNEQPRNGEWGIELDPTIKWDEASPSDTFDVYVGTDFNSVNDAGRTDQTGLLFYSENQDLNSYSLIGTTVGTTYYWRIDAVVGGEPEKGDVWHFTTFLPDAKSTVIGDWEQQMDGWIAADPNDPNMVLDYSTSGATLNNYSLAVEVPENWYETVRIPINENGFTYQLKANNRFSLDVTWDTSSFVGDIESIVIDGDGIGRLQLAPQSETVTGSVGDFSTTRFTWDYSAIDFSLLPAEPNELTLSIATMADTGGVYYFDNARLYNSRLASDPMRGSDAAEVQTEPILSWTPGEGAGTHNIYFGTDYDNVNNASESDHSDLLFYDEGLAYDANKVDIAGELGYPLPFGATYYWRVDEVNEVVWKGEVWSFTVGRYHVIDDFETYGDYPPDEVWSTWLDGYDNPANGSTAGYPDPDFVFGEHYLEGTIVHSGNWSLPLFYDNSAAPVSEVTRTFDSSMRNWTVDDVDTLTLFYYGDPANIAEPMYIVVDNAVVTNDDADAALTAEWTRWDIPLQSLADKGVNLSNVGSMTIGFGNKSNPAAGGGTGRVFFDDIRLYLPVPEAN